MSSKKHPLGEKRNHPGSKLRQGFWMVFRFGVNNWGKSFSENLSSLISSYIVDSKLASKFQEEVQTLINQEIVVQAFLEDI
ncbi:hypothetical protein [Streptococcus pneumoniae]|uniref:hypothetical protein n=1 Tax=Streptococcus pneumoniae TaxID=1313 RepID=UPI002954C57E|nr:hypothetical protein [Streptococcus pneumoniae]BDS68057.1 hypothetical protein PC0027_19620 [Streptococcus pneumoniae]